MNKYDKSAASFLILGIILFSVGIGIMFKEDCEYNNFDAICNTGNALYWTGFAFFLCAIIIRFTSFKK